MKLSVIAEPPKKEWTPVALELVLETVEEARLFYHILNDPNLRDLLFTRGVVREGTAKDLGVGLDVDMIKGLIESQGFSI